MQILVTGGLGYIGSHVAHFLKKKAVIIDNSSNSKLNYKKYLKEAIVYKQEINKKNLRKIFLNHKIKCVIHLAGYKSVSESVKNPLKYYENNIRITLDLLEVMSEFQINKLIFSSSATVYGMNNKPPFKESYELSSNNPYGNTKIINEKLIKDFCYSNKNFKAISLRYFNPVGSDTKSGLKDQPENKSGNLMPLIIESINKKKDFLIYGKDYPTNDGTCIRDYIHINDLAKAHILSLKALNKTTGYEALNIGLGRGISVLEIIKIFEKVNKIKVNYKYSNRREGDIAVSYADTSLSKKKLSWRPSYTYEQMLRDAWLTNKNINKS